jgi:diguanylate cyclase (GGDEF)-like protein/PAS domain S-box-containing protein
LAPVGEALLDAFVPPLSLDGPPSIDFVVNQESVVDGVAVTLTDPATGRPHLMYVSPNLAAILGCDADDLLGRPLVYLFGGEPPPHQREAIERDLPDGAQVEVSHLLRHHDGGTVAVHATHVQLPSIDANTRYRILLVRDLARRSAEQLLADQALVVDSLARGQDLGSLCHQVATHVDTVLYGRGRCWIGVNDLHDRLEAVVTAGHDLDLAGRVMRLVMGSGEPTVPRSVLVENLPPDLGQHLAEVGVVSLWAFPAVDSNGASRGALIVTHPGEGIPTDDEIRLLDHLAQVLAAAIERAALEATLAHRLLHDPLTQLPNRALIVDRLEQALARLDREPSTLSVLLVDIDRFKSINDRWGSEAGDQVLLEVANRLLGSVRLGDTVGRISSDQFLMVCVANGDIDASHVARRVIDSVADPVRLAGGREVHITVSVGVVSVDEAMHDAAVIISQAESALARAVESGRGRFALFDEGMQRQVKARHDLEHALAQAIVEGQLVLHYQPVCEVATGRMIGAEALVRWDRPGHGLLGPGHFIDVAEETGLIVPLGAWVIDEVARALATWPKASGLSPVITVNLSARQLADESLVPTVLDALDAHQLPPVRLGFEVTESMQVDDFEAASDALAELSKLGCRIAIDDFGIGYATLDYLRRFSMADVLKIDRSFVTGIGRSREDAAIVSASMALAKSLDLRVVAEGVEHLSQLDYLRDIGCHYAQGYALSAPVPLDAVLELWKTEYLFEVEPPDPTPPTPSALSGVPASSAPMPSRRSPAVAALSSRVLGAAPVPRPAGVAPAPFPVSTSTTPRKAAGSAAGEAVGSNPSPRGPKRPVEVDVELSIEVDPELSIRPPAPPIPGRTPAQGLSG